jgi:uncharacterized protein YdbL (DUF1318 family)
MQIMSPVTDDVVPVAPAPVPSAEPVIVKPGYLTTEFWTTIAAFVGNLVVVLTLIGKITPDQANKLNASLTQLWAILPMLLANGYMLYSYITSRNTTKQVVQEINLRRLEIRQQLANTNLFAQAASPISPAQQQKV